MYVQDASRITLIVFEISILLYYTTIVGSCAPQICMSGELTKFD